MSNDMPDVIYAKKYEPYEACCEIGKLETWDDHDNCDHSTKYYSESYKDQLIKEAEQRQRERLMAVIERHDDHGQISVQVITDAILNAGGER